MYKVGRPVKGSGICLSLCYIKKEAVNPLCVAKSGENYIHRAEERRQTSRLPLGAIAGFDSLSWCKCIFVIIIEDKLLG
jgi:predicted metal-binding transcription factor (methanogenesis marker protein 9)